jgi:tetratricopeptide (TPR) repeat protein
MKIQGGLFRAILYGPQVAKHQSQALKHGASNPRVRYLNGTGLLHTAKNADDLRKALEELRTAEALFDAEALRPARGHNPRWGAASCQQFIGRALERLGRSEEAITAYRKALTLQPGDHESAEALRRLNTSP